MGRTVLISFSGHAQPTGDLSMPDINHSAFAKHLKFDLNELSKMTTQHGDSLHLWKKPLGGLQNIT